MKPAKEEDSIGKCHAAFKVKEYSFIHDRYPTPNGLSITSFDAEHWTYQAGPGLSFKIHKSTDSCKRVRDGNIKAVIVVSEKPTRRSPDNILVRIIMFYLFIFN